MARVAIITGSDSGIGRATDVIDELMDALGGIDVFLNNAAPGRARRSSSSHGISGRPICRWTCTVPSSR